MAGSMTKPPFNEHELTFLLRFYRKSLSEFCWEEYPILVTITRLQKSKAMKEVNVHHL
jgi:hypothetical protein